MVRAQCLCQSYKQKDANESKQSLKFQFSLCTCSYNLQKISICGVHYNIICVRIWVKFSSAPYTDTNCTKD